MNIGDIQLPQILAGILQALHFQESFLSCHYIGGVTHVEALLSQQIVQIFHHATVTDHVTLHYFSERVKLKPDISSAESVPGKGNAILVNLIGQSTPN